MCHHLQSVTQQAGIREEGWAAHEKLLLLTRTMLMAGQLTDGSVPVKRLEEKSAICGICLRQLRRSLDFVRVPAGLTGRMRLSWCCQGME